MNCTCWYKFGQGRETIILILIALFLLSNAKSQAIIQGAICHSPNQKVFLVNISGKKVDSAVIDSKHPTFSLKAGISEESYFDIFYQKKGPFILNQLIMRPGEHVSFTFDDDKQTENPWIELIGFPASSERITAFRTMRTIAVKNDAIEKEIL